MKINKIIVTIVALFVINQTTFSGLDSELGGLGNLNIKTRDINIKELIRDINILTFDVTRCETNITSSCGNGSVCNVTSGPCVVKTGQTLNAAPREIDFSRFLTAKNPLIVTSKKPATMPVFDLDQKNNYTVIIRCPFANISYMFIALPTGQASVDTIKNLPLSLAQYLKRKTGSFIKIYQAKGTSSQWSEISETQIGKSLDNSIMKRSNIINIEIDTNGNLVVTYKNLKRKDGTIIPTTRVTYADQK